MSETAPLAPLYERDFVAWTMEQARLVRANRLDQLDLENLAEEIDAMGGSQRSEIGSRLIVILEHLLQWEFQPEHRTYGWRASIIEQRVSIETLVDNSPSLKGEPAKSLARAYRVARVRAASETGLPEPTFPVDCPYGLADILRHGFYPGREERDII